jgi:SAM-dependent methyltransferase
MPDPRREVALYYDLQHNPTADVPFYRERLPGAEARVLEIGCGTGRVLLPLAPDCRHIHGIDHSPAMLEICRRKLAQSGLPAESATLTQGDIAGFELGQRFDLIIAPYRVFQNLETDAQVAGLFGGLRRHLAPGGRAILNAFRPNAPREALCRSWVSQAEEYGGESPLAEGRRVVWHYRRARLVPEPLVFYPEFIYRLYARSGQLEKETVMSLPMRCWYPDDFAGVVREHGFEITGKWGGYLGEPWGEGPELVVEFAETAAGKKER